MESDANPCGSSATPLEWIDVARWRKAERARLIDGQLRLDSNSTGGLTVSVRVGNTLDAFPGPTDAERVSP